MGNLVKVTAPNWMETTYEWGGAGRLLQKTTPDAGTVLYEYDADGNLRFSQDANQSSEDEAVYRTYDEQDRLLTTADYGTGSSTSSSLFDVSGITYDRVGNIETLQRDDDSGNLIDNLDYSFYDGTNRLENVTDLVSATSESWDAEDAGFDYDASGNLTSQTGKFSDIVYDHRNLPVHFYLDGGAEVVANYNAGGQRILKELKGGGWQFYVMDGSRTLAVIDQNGLSHVNLWGAGLFGRIETVADTISLAGARRYYITDHLGSTRAVVDGSGTVLETFDYYPFGLLMPQRSTGGANTLEKFTGKERDDEGGLNLDYFGARYYDPAIGRWHSVDPLAEEMPSWSPFNYTFNNPLAFIDPDGKAPLDWYLDNETKEIHWINGSAEQEGYTHLGEDITFTFNSYIDADLWGAPLGSLVAGNKLTTSITIDATSGEDGSIAGVSVSFGRPKIGETFGFVPGQESVPGLPNLQDVSYSGSDFSAMLEHHTMVHPVEATGLNILGFDHVNVAQRLSISNKSGMLSVSAATDVFPSASLSVSGNSGSANLFRYDQPSFRATHQRIYEIKGSGYPVPTVSRRSPYKFYSRYSSGN